MATKNVSKSAGLLEANERLVTDFGAARMTELSSIPDFRTFKNGLFYSHRDFDKFYGALLKGEPSSIVSGLNPSGRLHLGHKVVFDTCLYFQREHGLMVYIPLSDDESYVSGKVKTREEALVNAVSLVRGLLAYGFDPQHTKVVLDFNYPEIFNVAMTLSRGLSISKVLGVYGYGEIHEVEKKDSEGNIQGKIFQYEISQGTNVGLCFYPAVQAAHVLLPEIKAGIKNTLVPIGPDEDAHLRIGRELAENMGYAKPAIIHARFMPDMSLNKMSKSRPAGVIFLDEPEASVRKKVQISFSGGRATLEEHRRLGGDPDSDISVVYLSSYFLPYDQGITLRRDYASGTLTSGEVKGMLTEHLITFTKGYQNNLSQVSGEEILTVLMSENGYIAPELRELVRKV